MNTAGNIQVKLGDNKEVKNISDLKIVRKLNDHIRIELRGLFSEASVRFIGSGTRLDVNQVAGEVVKNLFNGVITDLQIESVAAIYTLRLKGASSTYELDTKLQTRSFQDINQNYFDFIKEILAPYPNALFELSKALNGKKLDRFFFQYQETDWTFLKRLASQSTTGLVPASNFDGIFFTFGNPRYDVILELANKNYEVHKPFGSYQEAKANTIPDLEAVDCWKYEVRTPEFLEVGQKVSFQNQILYVLESRAVLEGELLMFDAVLTTAGGLKTPKIGHEQIVGIAREGKVIGVQNDRVNVHFNVDRNQKRPLTKEKAFGFPYASHYTAAGNTGWYWMPELNDSVKVYFPTNVESEGVAMSAIRRVEKTSERIKDPEVKYLRTRTGKELKLDARQLSLSTNQSKLKIRLDNKDGIEIAGEKGITIESGGDIVIGSRKKMVISSKKAIHLECKGNKIELNQEGDLEYIGKVKKDVGNVWGNIYLEVMDLFQQWTGAWAFGSGTGPENAGQGAEEKKEEKQEKKQKTDHCYRHAEFLKELEQFPEDYQPALEKLHDKHIEWRFIAYKTGVDFKKFLEAEMEDGVSVTNVETLMRNPRGGLKDLGGYYTASQEAISFYLDPHNFLTEIQIFQFLSGKYNHNTQNVDAVKKVLNGKLKGKEEIFLKAGATNACAVFLAAKAMVETAGGTSSLATGSVEGYKGWFNMYGIHASDGVNSHKKGANYARESGWDDPDKAIIGGGQWIYQRYLAKGQDTLYTMKWNIEYYKKNSKAGFQYATSIRDAYNKAYNFSNGLKECEAPLSFRIPIYENMP